MRAATAALKDAVTALDLGERHNENR